MSDSHRYRLNASQQQVWRDLVPKPVRRAGGSQATIAKALHRLKGQRLTLATWKNRLTAFFAGEATGLEALFGNPEALAIVAEALGRTPQELENHLRTAAGGAEEDDIHQLRIPGFEDLGPVPVLDAFFPPAQGEVRWMLSEHGQNASTTGGQLDLGKLVEAVEQQRDDLPMAIVVVASAGLGKTPTLRALAARLAEVGLVAHQGPVDSSEVGAIFVQDDLDRLPATERRRLVEAVRRTKGTLLATSSVDDRLHDLPDEKVVARLEPGHVVWGCQYLEHLEQVLAACGQPVDLGPLRDWIEDDPYASGLAARVDSLGILARHLSDGGTVPVRREDVLRLSLGRWERRLRQQGRGPTALTLRLLGARALGEVVLEARRGGGGDRFSAAALSTALVKAAHGTAGRGEVPWVALGPQGMLTVVDALMEVGLLEGPPEALRLVSPALAVAVLGRALAGRLDDQELVRAVVLDPSVHDALLVAAEVLGDPSPVLAAIDEQPPGVRCTSYAAVTRLLSASPTPSDRVAFDRAFRRCLRWWAAFPASKSSFTMSLGGTYEPRRTLPDYQRVANLPPLVALGLASARHRDVLSKVDVRGILDGSMPEVEARYLDALGMSASEQDVRLALLVGAPWQSDEILDGSLWGELPPLDRHRVGVGRLLNDEDYWFWLRMIGLPRVQAEPDGDLRIAGIAGGMSVASMVWTGKRGSGQWTKALRALILARKPEAPRAFGRAVASLLERGGRLGCLALKELFDGIPERLRQPLREAAVEEIPLPPSGWTTHQFEDWAVWLLKSLVIEDDQRRRYWEAWTMAGGSEGLWIPWKAFLAAGVPGVEIARWALDTLPSDGDQPRAELEPLRAAGPNPAGLAFMVHEAERAPQLDAIEHLLGSSDVDALRVLALDDRDVECRRAALARLVQLDRSRARALCFEIASDEGDPQERWGWLAPLHPETGEGALWTDLAHRAGETWERMICLVRADCAEDDAAGWRRTRVVIALLDAILEPKGAAFEAAMTDFEVVCGPWASSDRSTVGQPRVDASGWVAAVLDMVGVTLYHARTLERPGIGAVVRHAFELDNVRAFIFGNSQPSWWNLAGLELGADFLFHALEEALGPEPRLTQERLLVLWNQLPLRPLVRQAAVRPLLREIAAPTVAFLLLRDEPDRVVEVVSQLPLAEPGGQPAVCSVLWLQRWAEAHAETAVEWLRGALVAQESELRRAWWQSILAHLPPGEASVDAIQQWSDA